MKKIYLASAIALSAFVLHTSAFAFGEKGTWSSGWGQGVSEYTAVNQAGDEIYIACSNMQPVSINLTVNGKSYGSGDDGGFDLILDGKTVQKPYETASRVGSNSFFYA